MAYKICHLKRSQALKSAEHLQDAVIIVLAWRLAIPQDDESQGDFFVLAITFRGEAGSQGGMPSKALPAKNGLIARFYWLRVLQALVYWVALFDQDRGFFYG
jgi:hypothetical protein